MANAISSDSWTKEEFECFVMIYASSVDGLISEEELNYIAENTGQSGVQPVIAYFKSISDSDKVTAIRSGAARFCPSQAEKDDLLNKMKAVFDADGRFSAAERGVALLVTHLV